MSQNISRWANALKTSITGSSGSSDSESKETKPKKRRYKFWKKPSNRTPGTIRQVRGAQFPPIETHAAVKPTPPSTDQIEQQNEEEEVQSKIEPVEITPTTSNSSSSNNSRRRNNNLMTKIGELFLEPNLELEVLRETCWSGIPPQQRPFAWKLLLDYLPRNAKRRSIVQEKRRSEYQDFLRKYYNITQDARTKEEINQLNQIGLDVPRTHPTIPWFHLEKIERALTRMLYIWALRHPASGYVQGMNDIISVFLYLFVDEYLQNNCNINVENSDSVRHIDAISEEIMYQIEADTFWCFAALLDNIQDNYTPDTPGLQRMVMRLEELVHSVTPKVAKHLDNHDVNYHSFALRWMNCILVRELPIDLVLRLFDTYLCQQDFASFHVYVCAAFLNKFSPRFIEAEYETIVKTLQNPPTDEFNEKDVEEILSQAWLWFTLYHNAQAHLH